MMWRKILRIWGVLAVIIVGTLVLLPVLSQTGFLPVFTGEYERTEIQVTDCNGTQKAELDVRIADSLSKKYVGLSRTSSLSSGEGLVFPYRSNMPKTIVMRNMDFGLDIVFVSGDGRINAIESLEEPSTKLEYYLLYDSVTRNGKYVIEVNKGWSNRTGVQSGDCTKKLDKI